MATRTDSFPNHPRGPNYAWDTWLDGSIWQLTRGEDFTIPARSFSASVYKEAKRSGVRVRVNVRGDNVYIQRL